MNYQTASPDRYMLLKDFARENRAHATLAEDILWQQLRGGALGVKFLRQYIIGDYIVDFVSRDSGLVIEVDGGYHAELRQKKDDAIRQQALEDMGFHVMRFANEEVLYDTENVICQIQNYFNE